MFKKIILLSQFLVLVFMVQAQEKFTWSPDGSMLLSVSEGQVISTDAKTGEARVLASSAQLGMPSGAAGEVKEVALSPDRSKLLLFANTVKVWRYQTRGDYFVFDLNTKKLRKLGYTIIKPQTTMFAKFSPDSKQLAYVSNNNIYTEDVALGVVKKLTTDGVDKLINGTFDWAYEEEFGCRDGFRWSPDSKRIAFWQVDARKVKEFFMIDNIDSNYSRPIGVEYPKVGEMPSPVKIGVVNITAPNVRWMNITVDSKGFYIPRMEWADNNNLIVQQLNRKQNESKLMFCDAGSGSTNTFFAENDAAWVDLNAGQSLMSPGGFNWVNNGQDLMWVSEKDGWRHVYKISKDGRSVQDITPGNFDIEKLLFVDNASNSIYFTASPIKAYQLYLYKAKLNNGSAKDMERLTPNVFEGFNTYFVAPSGKTAVHKFTSRSYPQGEELVSLPDHKPVSASLARSMSKKESDVEYMTVTSEDNIQLDAWIRKPQNFDPKKKYPIVFYVYGEPWGSTVEDSYGSFRNYLYAGSMERDGYIQASIDVRGTPSLKGAGWRKSIYKNIGILNIKDFATGAKDILELPFVDKDRVAVWGWSGGGASTLNLLFQYPDIFKTGIAIAAISNQLFYDNIYQERYMGLPQEDIKPFEQGSPATHAAGLKGNLLYIHGTADDNVHYSNAEYLIRALVKNNKQFSFMAYPNSTHSLSEGENTFNHLQTLYTNYLREHCPPGGK